MKRSSVSSNRLKYPSRRFFQESPMRPAAGNRPAHSDDRDTAMIRGTAPFLRVHSDQGCRPAKASGQSLRDSLPKIPIIISGRPPARERMGESTACLRSDSIHRISFCIKCFSTKATRIRPPHEFGTPPGLIGALIAQREFRGQNHCHLGHYLSSNRPCGTPSS